MGVNDRNDITFIFKLCLTMIISVRMTKFKDSYLFVIYALGIKSENESVTELLITFAIIISFLSLVK